MLLLGEVVSPKLGRSMLLFGEVMGPTVGLGCCLVK